MPASTTLYETRVWLIDPLNPTGQTVVAGSGGSVGGGGQRTTTKTRSGGIRTYGNGRVRNVAGANTQVQYTLALIHVAQADKDQLEEWMNLGTVVLLRDTYGQKDFGTIFSVSEYAEPMTVAQTAQAAASLGSYAPNGPFYDVAFTFNVVSVLNGS